jgi:hypothetical protein
MRDASIGQPLTGRPLAADKFYDHANIDADTDCNWAWNALGPSPFMRVIDSLNFLHEWFMHAAVERSATLWWCIKLYTGDLIPSRLRGNVLKKELCASLYDVDIDD